MIYSRWIFDVEVDSGEMSAFCGEVQCGEMPAILLSSLTDMMPG